MRTLRASVETLVVDLPARRQHQIASALRNLGDSLELLPKAEPRARSDLYDAARWLEALPVDSVDRADVVKEGLTSAQRALLAQDVSADRTDAYFDAVARLSQAREALDRGRALPEQQPTVASAFQAATDAVFLAFGEAGPFATEAPREAQALASTEAELAEASAAVLELGRASRPTQASAHALSSLADAIASIDDGRGRSSHILRMRVQAKRLEHSDALSFRRAEWIKTGLEVALDAIAADDKRAAPFTHAARDAVQGIDKDGSLSFQRGVIQDAFRTTLHALAAAAHPAATCPSDTTAAIEPER